MMETSETSALLIDALGRWRKEHRRGEDEEAKFLVSGLFPGRKPDEDEDAFRAREVAFLAEAARALTREMVPADLARSADRVRTIDGPLRSWLQETMRERLAIVRPLIDLEGIGLIRQMRGGWMARGAFPDDRPGARAENERADDQERGEDDPNVLVSAGGLAGDFPSEAWLRLLWAGLRHLANGGSWPPERPRGWMRTALTHFLSDRHDREATRQLFIKLAGDLSDESDEHSSDAVGRSVQATWAQTSRSTEQDAAASRTVRVRQDLCAESLARLKPESRVVLRLSYGWGLTSDDYRWIASKLGLEMNLGVRGERAPDITAAADLVRETIVGAKEGRGDLEVETGAIASLLREEPDLINQWRTRGRQEFARVLEVVVGENPSWRFVLEDLGVVPASADAETGERTPRAPARAPRAKPPRVPTTEAQTSPRAAGKARIERMPEKASGTRSREAPRDGEPAAPRPQPSGPGGRPS